MTAVLFGSIGTLADTSELQREAFNDAFAEHGLSWTWSREEYRALLDESGGESRIAAYAKSRGEDVDAASVHRTKSETFQAKLRSQSIVPREGVVETIAGAHSEGYQVALVTTTSAENVAALTEALSSHIDPAGFTLVLDRSSVESPKPSPDVYRVALERLGESAETCVAIEDNLGGVRAASAAGVAVLAFPGANNSGGDFGLADRRVAELALADLDSLISAA